MNEYIINQLSTVVPRENIFPDEPMSRHTTFRTGGNADCYIKVTHRKQLIDLFKLVKEMGRDYYVVGNGSNLLVSDNGYKGIIISMLGGMNEVTVEGNTIYAQAGALNSQIASVAKANELTGFEFAAGIPGTIGGAMIMNAGAYGGEMAQVTEYVDVLNKNGEPMVLTNSAMEFEYRNSVLKNSCHIVLGAKIVLKKGDAGEIEAKMKELASKRKEKQPLEYPSAGSTFKRPAGNFAGKLIEDAGLKGYSIGGAQVSKKHSGFIINTGTATSTDIYNLIKDVQNKVLEESGIELETEVIMLGKF
ncbi:MAG: UDP-N-acetylmuramate dehydrogenase [Butyrivibrio sp.]|nr:UDP-N-acetylmuramate dehydrogenase [Butyrivibrio sp.]